MDQTTTWQNFLVFYYYDLFNAAVFINRVEWNWKSYWKGCSRRYFRLNRTLTVSLLLCPSARWVSHDVPVDATFLSHKYTSLGDKIKGTTPSIFVLPFKDERNLGKSSFNDSCCPGQNPNLRKTTQELCETNGCITTFVVLQYFRLISGARFGTLGL